MSSPMIEMYKSMILNVLKNFDEKNLPIQVKYF